LHAALIRAMDRSQVAGAVLSETAYELNAYTVLIPDISMQLLERPAGAGFFRGAPEIAIEILSRANSRLELDHKARAYWTAGATAVWVIDAEARKAYWISRTGEWMEADRIEIPGGIAIDVVGLLPEGTGQ
jgi:Uma2 family endonuclease